MKYIALKSKKPLVHDDGTESFSVGKNYPVEPSVSQLNHGTPTVNNQGQRHILGVWHKKFKFV